MNVLSQERNRFRRVVFPEDTINKISNSFKKLNLKENIIINNVHPNLWSAQLIIESIRSVSNGKGTSKIEAIVSAYAEMVERISAGMETGINIAPFKQLYGTKSKLIEKISLFKYVNGYKWAHQDSIENSIHVEDLLKHINISRREFDYIKMNSELMRHWIPGYSIVTNKEVYIPILLIKWISATNGLGAGNSIGEAVVHSVCEIFEKHALITFLKSNNPSKYPIVDLNSISDVQIQEIIKYFKSNNIEVVIKDIGSGLYPVYALITINHSLPKEHIMYNCIKAGCSFDSYEAIKRCFTERLQNSNFEIEMSQSLSNNSELSDKYMPIFLTNICPINLDSFIKGDIKQHQHFTETDIKVEVEKCIEIAKKLNTEIVVINHTHKVFDFPVVRTIIPGISDFTRWWSEDKLNPYFLSNIIPSDEEYENRLFELLQTF